MCFALYAGTEKAIPEQKWNKDAPDLFVQALSERDAKIKDHFTKSEVQYIGSTSGCGCDFPHVSLQNGSWPVFDDDEEDPEWEAKDKYNRESLVTLIRKLGEESIELYGVWDGDFSEIPKIRETISVQTILDPSFLFKEQGFYTVAVNK